ncbi:MAG: hypothetical protein AAGJ93_07155 [Bacteroidota bacterium]
MKDNLFFGIVGINIMEYSNVMDILLSPLVDLSRSLFLLLFFILACVFVIMYPRLQQMPRLDGLVGSTKEKNNNRLRRIAMLAIMIACFFLGTGIGGGFKVAGKVSDQAYEMEDKITLIDGSEIKAKIISQNSGYIFYLEEGETNITISPITGVVQKINKAE